MLKPDEFLKIAILIRKEKKFPAHVRYRTAMNRAYYAAFIASKAKLVLLGKNFGNNDQIQEHVIENLKSYDPFLSDQLFALHKDRIKSDYDGDVVFQDKDASTAIQQAKFLIEGINTIKNNERQLS